MELRDLLRFSHCGRTVYRLEEPAACSGLRCPVCGQLVRFGLAEAPVRIRCPFRNGHHASCCFIMTSQQGAEGFREENQSELHVGVSTSAGVVFSYTEGGDLSAAGMGAEHHHPSGCSWQRHPQLHDSVGQTPGDVRSPGHLDTRQV
ncbi:MKRN2 opposite strand%2C tandem duplicate 1 [Scomber scombrus]|uniref:MKRN2 opposite strand, tandem duplicate 1 n=1 Tax=Scomber scombrus TaxID=13677 RepID=A0AAV1PXM7_SCOSC